MVFHHFGNKRGFAAAVEPPIDLAAEARLLLAGDPNFVGERLVSILLDLSESDSSGESMRALIRSASNYGEAAEQLHALVTTQILGSIMEHLGLNTWPELISSPRSRSRT